MQEIQDGAHHDVGNDSEAVNFVDQVVKMNVKFFGDGRIFGIFKAFVKDNGPHNQIADDISTIDMDRNGKLVQLQTIGIFQVLAVGFEFFKKLRGVLGWDKP